MTPLWGKHFALSFLLSTHLSPGQTLEGRRVSSKRPRKDLGWPGALLSDLQRNKDAVRCAALGAEVLGHPQKLLSQTLIVRLLKTHLITPFLDCKTSTE